MTTTKSDPRTTPPPTVLDVVIIGGGPAGLVSAKSLIEKGITSIALVEETASVGGMWNVDDEQSRPKLPCWMHLQDDNKQVLICEVPCSSQPVYQGLRANTPKELSTFQGLSFDDDEQGFMPKASAVAAYFQRYARHFALDQVTHYNTRVEKCTRQASDHCWKIETSDTSSLSSSGTRNQIFYSRRILVCSGHSRKAFAPFLRGMEHFIRLPDKTWLHSSAFQSVDAFAQRTVLIVGGSISAAEIGKRLLVKGNCPRIIISTRKWTVCQSTLLPKLMRLGAVVRPGIHHIDADGRVHFESLLSCSNLLDQYTDTTTLPITEQPDVILFATGYRYHFPFFDQPTTDAVVKSDGFKMKRLYKRMVSIDDPTLAFVGITNKNFPPTVVMEYQALWYAHMLQLAKNGNPSPLQPDTRLQEQMQAEVAPRAADTTQDALLFQFPAYCNSLAHEINVRGFWTQMWVYRLPLLLRSLWVQGMRKQRQHGWFGWKGFLLVGTAAVASPILFRKMSWRR